MGPKNKYESRKIILLLLLAIVALLIIGVIVIDFAATLTGYDLPIPLVTQVKQMALKRKLKEAEDPYLLQREELSKYEERLRLQEELLMNRENELSKREVEVEKRLEAVTEREKQLDQKQDILAQREKQYDDYEKNIREQAEKLFNMPPPAAVVILEQQSEADIVGILRAIDRYAEEIGSASTASYLLTLFEDKEKSANVFRKLKYSSSGDELSGVEILDNPDAEEPPAP